MIIWNDILIFKIVNNYGDLHVMESVLVNLEVHEGIVLDCVRNVNTVKIKGYLTFVLNINDNIYDCRIQKPG